MKNNDPLWEAPESTSDSPQHLTVFCSSISIDLSQIVNFYVFLCIFNFNYKILYIQK